MLFAAAAIFAVPGAARAQARDPAAMEARLKQLEEAVAALRAELDAARAQVAKTEARVVAQGTANGAVETRLAAIEDKAKAPTEGFRVGASTFKIGGFVRTNLLASFYGDGELAPGALGREFYLPQQIPVGGRFSSQDLLVSARQTRLVFSSATPLGKRTIKTHVEFDFALATAPEGAQRATNPFTPTFRRGFVEFGRLLLGQEWTTFQNVAALPESADFVGPLEGTVFVRQPLIRYSHPLGDGLTLQAAVENPQTESALPDVMRLVDNDDDHLPDTVLRLNWKSKFGDLSLAGIVRELRVETGGVGDSTLGWGISGAGRIPFGKRHDLRFMATYGEGIGRYLGLGAMPDAIYAGPGSALRPVRNLAGFAAIKLGWTDTLRSTFVGSYQRADYPRGLAITPLANSAIFSASANIFWTPFKRFDAGIEFRHAERTLLSGATGRFDRIEIVGTYSF